MNTRRRIAASGADATIIAPDLVAAEISITARARSSLCVSLENGVIALCNDHNSPPL